jgi:hypothetical protein
MLDDVLIATGHSVVRKEVRKQMRHSCIRMPLNVVKLVFENQILTIPRELTKSREHRLPLSDFLVSLLKKRHAYRKNSTWVFQSTRDHHKHLSGHMGIVRRVNSISGIKFACHDLRRTFLTMGEKLDVPHYSEFALSDLLKKPGDSVLYAYDFGDGWMHDVVLERRASLPLDDFTAWAKCLHGKRACPPEDCFGVTGYADFLDAIEDPLNKNRKEKLDWAATSIPTHLIQYS